MIAAMKLSILSPLLCLSLAWSAETEPDPDLPQKFDPTSLTGLVSASPFNRSINLADTIILTGMAYVNGKAMANLLDSETKKTYIVSDVPNASGWVLESAVPARDFKLAQVKVRIGGELVTIRSNTAAVAAAQKGGPPPPSGGSERGRGPSEGDRGYSKGHRGPSREDMDRFNSMSPEAQEKVKNLFREGREKIMSMNEDDRRTYIRSQVEKIAADDAKGNKGGR